MEDELKKHLSILFDEFELSYDLPFFIRIGGLRYNLIVKVITTFIIIDYVLTTLITRDPTFHIYHFLPILLITLIIGLILVFFARSFLLNILEIFGLRRKEKLLLSVGNIFTQESEFKEARYKALKKIFFKKSDGTLSILTAIALYVSVNLGYSTYMYIATGDPSYFFLSGKLVVPWSILAKILSMVFWIFLLSLLISLSYFILRTIFAFKQILSEKQKFAIFNSIEFLNTLITSDNDKNPSINYTLIEDSLRKGQYTIFYIVASQIVSLYNKIGILFLGLAITNVALTWFLYIFGRLVTILRVYTGIAISVVTIILALYLFFNPQLYFHNLLKSFKDSILYALKELYERTLFYFLEDSSVTADLIEDDLIVFKKAIDLNKNLRTWPYTSEQAIKLFGTMIILLETILLQFITIFK